MPYIPLINNPQFAPSGRKSRKGGNRMVTKTKRRTRRNPKRATAKRYSKKYRKRPTMYKVRGKWYGSKRGGVKSGTRVNPKRRRKVRKNASYVARKRRRRNPQFKINRLISRPFLMQVAGIGGGIALGYLTLPLMYKILPTEVAAKNRRFLGIVNVVLGGLMAGMLKNKTLKSMGITVAGTGVYDLIAANTQDMLGLPTIPETSMLLSKALPAPAPEAEAASASYETGYMPVSDVAMGASYMPLGGSYESDMDTIGLGHDYGSEVYEGIL